MLIRSIIVLVIAIASIKIIPAQNLTARAQKTLEVLRTTLSGEMRLADYGDGLGSTFADAKLPAATKQRIAASIPDDFFDSFPYQGSTQDAINKSRFHSLGLLPGEYRFDWFLFDTGGSNDAIAIVETSTHKAKLLGEGFGWGLRAIYMPNEAYPLLVVPQTLGGGHGSFGAFLFTNGVYKLTASGHEDESSDDYSSLTWSLCDPPQ